MNPEQAKAFYDASGIHANALTFDIRLFVGGVALVSAVLVLAGLMHLLDSQSPKNRLIFLLSVLSLAFSLMLIFLYIA